MERRAVLAVVLYLLTVVAPAEPFRFDLVSGKAKCVAEDVPLNVMTVGTYTVVNESHASTPNPSQKITVKVRSPNGNEVHSAESVDSGHFGFTTTEGGDYMACFWTANQKPGVTITVEFDWRSGIAAKEWPKVAKRNKIDSMTIELKKMGKIVEAIHEEMLHLREREAEMQDMNTMTGSKMALFTLLSLAACLSVAGLQLYHLKTFFERKKLL